MNKKNYSVNELIHNPSFRRMVRGEAEGNQIEQWNQWMQASDENREKARKVISEVAGFEFADPSQPDLEKQWRRLYRSTVGKKTLTTPIMMNKRSPFKWIYRIAAILVLGGIVGIGLYTSSVDKQDSPRVEQIIQERTITTESDERTTVKFANGSKLVLNSNSLMTYSVGTLQDKTIEVVLEGEAYFDAKSDAGQSQPVFAVQTPDGVIRDIGTEFVVSVQNDRSRVVLQEGKVEVKIKNKKKSASDIAVAKGEMLEFNKSQVIDRKTVNATFYTSWATGFMQFDQTAIREFARFVEQKFDLEVEIVDPQLADITMEGGIYYKSLNELIQSVSEIAKIPVYQSKNRKTVYIGDKTDQNAN